MSADSAANSATKINKKDIITFEPVNQDTGTHT